MDKARQAHFRAEIIDGEFHGWFGGTYDDLALCVEQGMVDTGIFRGVFDYWRGHVLTSIFGAACIYGALRGLGAVLHLMGVC